ncbi:integral membrane protein S linking to the trans Golgi network-domain-containing protein [Mycena belliarum]|uniref:Integral membrane protein S linking to the trans Golgi network-domain-containing protein n=1 Tax=Mycena belliarum TaxID=1033014 RepID=A0AAD6U5N0_9AGAR|nr:integral membrane protein S linking to the trans Golgi network-domain-containing protein [Mycena belliae]
MAPPSISNWDPVFLVSQIVSLQSLHYLTLSVCVPPLLNLFAEPASLNYEGGAANVGMVMDWREMAGRPTVRGMQGEERWSAYTGVWRGGRKVGVGWRADQWDGRTDPMRGWVIAFCWLVACSADIYYLYTLIRRPRLILDFALTLVFNHLVLTTYYSASLPTSLFFWAVMLGGAALMIICAEQLCVKREMAEGLQVAPLPSAADQDVEEMEMGLLPRNSG